MNKKQRKGQNEKGFTMVELIIVVAIMGIIGALLVPAYSSMTAKARLTTDISTVKTLQRTAESYKAEQGTFPAGANVKDLTATLKTAGYLNADVEMQTKTDITVTAKQEIKLNTTTLIADAYKDAWSQIDASTTGRWTTGEPAGSK